MRGCVCRQLYHIVSPGEWCLGSFGQISFDPNKSLWDRAQLISSSLLEHLLVHGSQQLKQSVRTPPSNPSIHSPVRACGAQECELERLIMRPCRDQLDVWCVVLPPSSALRVTVGAGLAGVENARVSLS